jgi:streptomycin 6-kinase
MGRDFSHIARRCERAVITAYRELRDVGQDDMAAFQACTTLYRVHHPEASVSEARRLVAEWVDHHVTRAAQGPTDGCACETD